MSPDSAHPHTLTDVPLLEIREASVMRANTLILDRLSLSLGVGHHTAILGPNGSGKSTLIRLIARQLYPLARRDGAPVIRVFGRERWNVSELRSLIGIVSPAVQLDYTSDAPLEVFDLSTGEARRVLIARALVHAPRALLLDEPCAGLDPASRRRFLESLRRLARGGTTLLLVTHHVEEIVPEIDHVLLLRDGRILREGNKQSVLTDDALSATFAMPVQVARHGDYYSAVVA